MARTYKHSQPRPNNLPALKITYHGFDKNFQANDVEHVLLVKVNGEREVFALDNPDEALEEVKAYLELRDEPYRILGLFRRENQK